MRPPPRPTPFPYTTLFRSPLDPTMLRATGARERKRDGPSVAVARGLRDQPRVHELVHGATGPSLVQPESPGERSEEHTSELQSQSNLVCRLLLEKKKLCLS